MRRRYGQHSHTDDMPRDTDKDLKTGIKLIEEQLIIYLKHYGTSTMEQAKKILRNKLENMKLPVDQVTVPMKLTVTDHHLV